MTSSLVGSEMCIRDRLNTRNIFAETPADRENMEVPLSDPRRPKRGLSPVSYTHLTLPTICSV
eukprot:1639368-Prorocentrum_lima.AAC.1